MIIKYLMNEQTIYQEAKFQCEGIFLLEVCARVLRHIVSPNLLLRYVLSLISHYLFFVS